MKIGIQTWGSHGDIRPFIALADGLQRAGHDVTLAITCVDSDRYRDLHSSTGYAIRMVATPVIPDTSLLERIGEELFHERNAIKQTQLAIDRFFLPVESEMFQASEQLCAENDLVIGHYFLYTLGAAAERYGRPYVSVVLVHGGVPSAFQPPSGVPNLGTLANRAIWWLARSVLNRSLKKYPDRLREKNGIKAARDLMDNVWASDQFTLFAISPTICERRPDWPTHFLVCGSFDIQAPVVEGVVSRALQDFLSNGSPPVYMTFGSAISGSDERQTIALLTDAAKEASVRAIIQAPRGHDLGFESSAQIYYAGSTPHAAVFPKCKLVVHHGGAGTSHAALRAGRPSVVVAHTAEQELWGRELERIGVASKLIRRRDATACAIATAIKSVDGSDRIPDLAKQLGARVAAEDGVSTAVRLIEQRFAD